VRAFEKTQLQAATDPLTGHLRASGAEIDRRGSHVSLAVADLDAFKAINDTHGHGAGDRALRLFAQVAQAALRDADLFGRWGGEEFVFALPDVDRHDAVGVLDRIRVKLAEAHTGDHPQFTASFGTTDSSQAESLEQLVQIADSGLYQSKHEGRDRVTIGEPDVADRSLLRDNDVDDSTGPEPARPRYVAPPLHDAADDEDPRPSGLEIR
jgi:diguanylate cyclase (GGDEF)-like protein